jgi:antitoxin PrlF
MATTMTIKGQVTIPKSVRDEVGMKPGDKLDVRTAADGSVIIEKPQSDYKARLYALAKRRLIRDGMTTDEFMKMMRGDPANDPPLKKK